MAGSSEVQPPPLPEGLPPDLRDFIECRATSATIRNGPLEWVALPPEAAMFLGKGTKPDIRIAPGAAPDAATITIKLGMLISVDLPMAIEAGRLTVNTSRVPGWVPGSVSEQVQGFVDALNGWLAANGQRLGSPTFGSDGMTLTKEPAA